VPRYHWSRVDQAKRHEELVVQFGMRGTRRGRQVYVPHPNRWGPWADELAEQVERELPDNQEDK